MNTSTHPGPLLPRDLFAGKTAFVTGGSSGINLAIADAYAAHGANVAICGRNAERLAAAVRTLQARGGAVRGHQADVRDVEQLGTAPISRAPAGPPAAGRAAGIRKATWPSARAPLTAKAGTTRRR